MILVGDANGSDKAIQHYLAAKNYRNVVVYCMGDDCRNNVGDWPTRCVYVNQEKKDFSYYSAKDVEMAKDASCGFMLWDGKSRGTLNNILNLTLSRKKVLVYFSLDKTCYTIKSMDDVRRLLANCGDADRRKFGREFPLIAAGTSEKVQADLFATR